MGLSRNVSAFLVAALLCMGVPAQAANRVQWLQSLQPPSSWLNIEERYGLYAGLGQFAFDLVGQNPTPFYTNFNIAPATGLNITVGPASTSGIAALYMPGPIDSVPFGSGANQLPADTHVIMHQGLLFSNVTLGPVAAPATAGQSAIVLVECQIQVLDQTLSTVNFVSSSNVASSSTANRDRNDVPVCQLKVGVAAAAPVAPTVDTNYIALGQFTVANGNTTIAPANITNFPGFAGFLPASSTSAYVTTNSAQTITATKTFNGVQNVAGQLNFPATGTATLAAVPVIAGDAQASPGMLVNVATASNGIVFYTGGVASGAKITPTGGLLGTSATIAGLTTTNGALVNVVGAGTLAQTVDLHDTTAAAATPDKYLRVAGGSLQILNSAGAANIATLSDTGTFAAPVIQGNTFLNAQNIAQNQCVTVDVNHNLISAGGACGLSSGTISTVAGTGNVTASTTSGAVTLGEVASPTFATATTTGLFYLGSDLNYSLNRAGAAFTLTPLNASAVPTLRADGGFLAGLNSQYGGLQAIIGGPVSANYNSGSVQASTLYDGGVTNKYSWLYGTGLTEGASVYGPTSATISGGLSLAGALTGGTTGAFSGAVSAGVFNGSGSGLSAGTIPNAALVTTALTGLTAGANIAITGTAPNLTVAVVGNGVTAVTGTGNIASSGGTSPNITLVAAPTISGANFTAATVPNAALVTPPLTGITAGANVSITGATPNFTVSAPGAFPMYDNTGAKVTGMHYIFGACNQVNSQDCDVALSGAAVFTSNTSYYCGAIYGAANANEATSYQVINLSTTGFRLHNINGPAVYTRLIPYFCVGN